VTAACSLHGAPSVATCSRCGVFLCQQEVRHLDAHVFCEACVARPDVDYLEAHRLRYWGRRDGWAYLFGVGGFACLLLGGVMLLMQVKSPHDAELLRIRLGGLLLIGGGILQLAWFFRQPWARYALPLGVLSTGLLALVLSQSWQALPVLLAPLGIFGGAAMSLRSKLFFKLEVSRDELLKDWRLHRDNRVARSAMGIGFLGLLVPLFAPLALVLGLVGLSRVNPRALPPVGNKGAAITGIVTGALGCLWGVVLASGVLR
jgi:hypothetical protein